MGLRGLLFLPACLGRLVLTLLALICGQVLVPGVGKQLPGGLRLVREQSAGTVGQPWARKSWGFLEPLGPDSGGDDIVCSCCVCRMK